MRDGVVIAGRYRILRPAGSGGMGTVFEAWDVARGVPVAVKTWRTLPDAGGRAEARLAREARALSEVEHPAVVHYVDHGATPEQGSFLVIEWVPGETLGARLAGSGLSPLEALSLATRLAGGLSALHARGIVHRDLKPENVMLPNPDPASAIIVDLGIARFGASDVTRTGAHLGTPRYMAPEQIRSARSVDGRADVFALGCILFEALTGRAAFEGADPVSVLSRILFEPPPSARGRRAELPAELDRLVRAMLEREPGRRPTAADVARGIVELSTGPVSDAIARLGAAQRMPDGGPLEPVLPGSTQDDLPETGAPPSFRVPGDAARDAVRRGFAPLTGPFFGRDEDERRLSSLVRGGTRLVNVWGGPGVGKSRLVAETTRRIVETEAPSIWDTVVLGDLSDARDVDDVVRILAREAGVSLEAGHPPEVALGTALGKLGRVLLVADPVDHVATTLAATLREWRGSARDLQVVAVSRARFCPPGGIALEVRPLSTEVATGDVSPAAALLLARAESHAVPAGGWGPEARANAEAIVRSLAGVPFAIELYAAQVAVLGLAGVLARLERQADATLELGEGAMRRAVEWSWALLDETEKEALARCAVFRGGFFADAAEEVLHAGGPAALGLVQSLREKALLVASTEGALGEARLSMLPAVREFAAEKLRASGGDTEVRSLHAAHFAKVFARETVREPATLSRLEREAENLLAAAEFALSGEAPESSAGLSCLIALEPAIFTRGITGSFRALLDRAVGGEADGGARATSHLRERARQIRARIEAPSDPARAAEDLALSLAEARRVGDRYFEARVLVDLGVAKHLARALEEATECYESALGILAPLDDPATEGRAIGNLGALAHDRGALEEAARHYRTAIALLEEAGEGPRRGNFLANLALVEQELGHVEPARELYERALSLLEPVREARLLAIAVGNYGVLALESGDPGGALARFERSLHLLAGARDKRSEAICQSRIGAALSLLGRFEEAEGRMARAERLGRKAADPVALEAVTLVRSVLSVARARKAAEEGDTSALGAHVRDAKAGIERARNAVFDGRPAIDQSDDVRATLRIVEKTLTGLEARR